MTKIAIDVVLIPPDNIIQFAMDINRTFSDTAEENYVLDAKTCIPHITLLMGLASRDQLPEVSHKLDVLAKKFSALKLKITHAKTFARPDGKVVSGLEIDKTLELQKLHEGILDEMSSIFTYDGVRKEMFYNPPQVNETPLFYVRDFAKTRVRENYNPHITLGVGEPNKTVTTVEFTASKLALCHLGNYCTCCKVLFSTKLEG